MGTISVSWDKDFWFSIGKPGRTMRVRVGWLVFCYLPVTMDRIGEGWVKDSESLAKARDLNVILMNMVTMKGETLVKEVPA